MSTDKETGEIYTDPISEFLGTATPAATGLDLARQEIEQDMEKLKIDMVEAHAVDDYSFVRLQLRQAIEKYGQLIPSLVRVTEASESPQQYGAAASFFKTFGDLNETLLDTAVKVKKVGASGKALPAPGKPTSPDGVEGQSTPVPDGDLIDPNDILASLISKKRETVVVVETKKT